MSLSPQLTQSHGFDQSFNWHCRCPRVFICLALMLILPPHPQLHTTLPSEKLPPMLPSTSSDQSVPDQVSAMDSASISLHAAYYQQSQSNPITQDGSIRKNLLGCSCLLEFVVPGRLLSGDNPFPKFLRFLSDSEVPRLT